MPKCRTRCSLTARVFQLDIQWKTPLGIGQVHREPTQVQALAFTRSANIVHVPAGKASSGPSGSLLSRTTMAGPVVPTSTQAPPLSPPPGDHGVHHRAEDRPRQAVYAATKDAVRTLLEGLRQESTDGVLRTTAVSPGFVRTELADSIDNPKSASRSAAAATSSPPRPTPSPAPSPLPSSSLMTSRLATSPSVRRPRLASEDHGGLRVAVCGREDQVWGRRHRS
jgi:NAD(P)-dependent dehydrogenase (short-subunit alcohol dehydrogenase family)